MAHCNNLAGIFDSDEDEEDGATYPQNIIELCGYLCNEDRLHNAPEVPRYIRGSRKGWLSCDGCGTTALLIF